MVNNLINNDKSRCNDYKCPTNGYCARFKQLSIDVENGIKTLYVTDFNGRNKKGLCDNFLNIDFINKQN